MNGDATILEARNLTVRRRGAEVLAIPEFTLCERESVALIGPNGAGKSTMLLTLATLLGPSQGEVLFHGSRVTVPGGDTSYRRKIAMVFQEPLLFDTTVFDNVAAGLKIRGLPAGEIRQRVGECLERFRIDHLSERSARRLSGGEVRRTSLARAFVTRPELVLLDEPFIALDPPTRHALMIDLAQVLRDSGAAAIIATHDLMEALRLADRMLVMQVGRVVQSGTTAEVSANPINAFVAAFVGMENVFAGTVVSAADGLLILNVAGQHLEMVGSGNTGERVVLCTHPEHVVVTTVDPNRRTSARNVFPGTVTRIVPLGAVNKVYLDCGFPLVAVVTGHSLDELGLVPGRLVFASFKATSVHLFRKGY
jgi:tungstate transport system ATP-binding protein